MNVCVVQPGYSLDYRMSDKLYDWEMNMMLEELMEVLRQPLI